MIFLDGSSIKQDRDLSFKKPLTFETLGKPKKRKGPKKCTSTNPMDHFSFIKQNRYRTDRNPAREETDQCGCDHTKKNFCGDALCSMRAMNFECEFGTCPVEQAGKACMNQRFQRQQYPKFEVVDSSLDGIVIFVVTAGRNNIWERVWTDCEGSDQTRPVCGGVRWGGVTSQSPATPFRATHSCLWCFGLVLKDGLNLHFGPR